MASPQTPKSTTPQMHTPNMQNPMTCTPKARTTISKNPFKTPQRPKKSRLSRPKFHMHELVEPGILSDREFAATHYRQRELCLLDRLKEAHRFRARAEWDEDVRTWSTERRFLEQRAESTEYSKRNSEVPPSYAAIPPELTEWGEVILKKRTQAEIDEDCKSLIEQERKGYDEAYERNLLDMEHGPACSCNKGNWPRELPQPTWTVRAGVKPMPRSGLPDPVTNKRNRVWDAATNLYNRWGSE